MCWCVFWGLGKKPCRRKPTTKKICNNQGWGFKHKKKKIQKKKQRTGGGGVGVAARTIPPPTLPSVTEMGRGEGGAQKKGAKKIARFEKLRGGGCAVGKRSWEKKREGKCWWGFKTGCAWEKPQQELGTEENSGVLQGLRAKKKTVGDKKKWVRGGDGGGGGCVRKGLGRDLAGARFWGKKKKKKHPVHKTSVTFRKKRGGSKKKP